MTLDGGLGIDGTAYGWNLAAHPGLTRTTCRPRLPGAQPCRPGGSAPVCPAPLAYSAVYSGPGSSHAVQASAVWPKELLLAPCPTGHDVPRHLQPCMRHKDGLHARHKRPRCSLPPSGAPIRPPRAASVLRKLQSALRPSKRYHLSVRCICTVSCYPVPTAKVSNTRIPIPTSMSVHASLPTRWHSTNTQGRLAFSLAQVCTITLTCASATVLHPGHAMTAVPWS